MVSNIIGVFAGIILIIIFIKIITMKKRTSHNRRFLETMKAIGREFGCCKKHGGGA